jgi:peroxiredoxin
MRQFTLKFSLRLFVILVSFALGGHALALEVGAPAPAFTLKNLQGETVSLADFKGRTVLLKLGTTWCPSCKQLGAALKELDAELLARDVALLDVFVQDSKAAVESYLEDKPMRADCQALLDDGQVYRAYNVYLIPRLLVVGDDQLLRYDSGGGAQSSEDVLALLDEYAPRKPVESQ